MTVGYKIYGSEDYMWALDYTEYIIETWNSFANMEFSINYRNGNEKKRKHEKTCFHCYFGCYGGCCQQGISSYSIS